MTSRAYGACSPRSHCDVILIVTSFAGTELATPSVTNVYDGHKLPRLIYKDVSVTNIVIQYN